VAFSGPQAASALTSTGSISSAAGRRSKGPVAFTVSCAVHSIHLIERSRRKFAWVGRIFLFLTPVVGARDALAPMVVAFSGPQAASAELLRVNIERNRQKFERSRRSWG